MELGSWIIEREAERYTFELAASYFNLSSYDILHCNDIISSIAMSRVKPPDTPLITTIHGSLHLSYKQVGWIDHPLSRAYSIMQEQYGATVSDRTIVPSKWFKNYLHRKFRIPLEQLVVIHNGFDVECFQRRLDSCLVKNSDRFYLGCVARLSREKGHRYLLEALGKLKQERSDWELWLIGDGPMRSELESQAEQLGIRDHIVFWGDVHDVSALLQQLDIFVLASLYETQSYATMEAQIAGKAVVVTNAGGIAEVVKDKITGLVSPVANSHMLYENIRAVMEDPWLRRKLGENAKREGRERWSLDLMTDKILEVYEECFRLREAGRGGIR